MGSGSKLELMDAFSQSPAFDVLILPACTVGNKYYIIELIQDKLCYSKFAKDHFYNVMSALPTYTCFRISGISVLEINSEMPSKSFIIFPFFPFSQNMEVKSAVTTLHKVWHKNIKPTSHAVTSCYTP